MRKKKFVVRVELDITAVPRPLDQMLEQLRYAGVIKEKRSAGGVLAFDIPAPHGLDSETWAKQNAERMRSFQYKASAVEKE